MTDLCGRAIPSCAGQPLRALLPALAVALEPICERVRTSAEPIVNVRLRAAAPARPGGEEHWLADVAPRFGAGARVVGVSVTLRAPLEAERFECELRDRRRFEQVLGEISAALVAAPASEIDARITAGLERIVKLLDFDLGICGAFDEAAHGTTARVTHWYGRGGVVAGALTDRDFPWYVAELVAGRVVRVATLADLPLAAATDRASSVALGIRSVVLCPLTVGGRIDGAMTFSSLRYETHWPDDVVRRLQLVAQLFGSALARQRAEDGSRRHQAALAHVGRVSALGEMAGAITHELRQPLVAVRANAQALTRMLALGTLEPGELREALGDIAGDAVRADEILQRLRGLLRKGDPEREMLDMNEVVSSVECLVGAEARGGGVPLHLVLGADLPAVLGDRIQLQQVLLNLVCKSVDAMRDTGDQVGIEIRTAPAGPAGLEIAVRDHGTPLGEGTFAQLFEPFYTTKANGLGIGLSLSRSIVEAHGGRLTAARNPVRGLTLRMTLPSAAVVGAPR